MVFRFICFLKIWRGLTVMAWRAAFATNVTFIQSTDGFTIHHNKEQE